MVKNSVAVLLLAHLKKKGVGFDLLWSLFRSAAWVQLGSVWVKVIWLGRGVERGFDKG